MGILIANHEKELLKDLGPWCVAMGSEKFPQLRIFIRNPIGSPPEMLYLCLHCGGYEAIPQDKEGVLGPFSQFHMNCSKPKEEENPVVILNLMDPEQRGQYKEICDDPGRKGPPEFR